MGQYKAHKVDRRVVVVVLLEFRCTTSCSYDLDRVEVGQSVVGISPTRLTFCKPIIDPDEP